MDKIDLEEVERLHKEATPGPWVANNWGRVWYTSNHDSKRLVCDTMRNTVRNPKSWRANASLIAAMRNAVPELIARVRELEAELATYKQPIDFPKLREGVAHVDNSLSDFLEDSIKRAAARP